MPEFITANIGTAAVLAVITVAVICIIRYLIKSKKSGKSCGCGCGCSDCPSHGCCSNQAGADNK